MWARIFRRIGTRMGRVTFAGGLVIVAMLALLAIGIYRLRQ